jgi:uncharacterized protein (DUF736 family)
MPEIPKDPNELGALWIKTSGRGEYMTGTISGQPVVVFRNDRKKEGSKAPDWRVMKPKPREPVAAASREPGEDDIEF